MIVKTVAPLLLGCASYGTLADTFNSQLKCVSSVSLLRFEFSSVAALSRFYQKRLLGLRPSNCLARWVESKISLVHQLIVERLIGSLVRMSHGA